MELYSDNMKLILQINNLNYCRTLQHNINLLSSWYKINNIELNPLKCKKNHIQNKETQL